MHRTLIGGQVQRLLVAHIAGREVAVLKVRVPPPSHPSATALPERGAMAPGTDSPSDKLGENVHVVLVGGVGLGTLSDAGRMQLRHATQGATSPTQARWRAAIGGGRVVAIDQDGLVIARDGLNWRAVAGVGELELALDLSTEPLLDEEEPPGSTLSAHGSRLVSQLLHATAVSRRDALRRAVVKARGRVQRRMEAVRGDLDRVNVAQGQAERARLFVPAAAVAPRGATTLTATDWSSGEARTVNLPLDPSRTAREQMDALFKRARRLKEGAKIGHARLSAAEDAWAALDEIADALQGDQDADVVSLENRARAAAPRDFKLIQTGSRDATKGSMVRGVEPPHPPYRVFLARSGARILVGRGAAHNDALTFHVARPHDMWLHTKHQTGAHVIVPLEKNGSCPADLLVEAAHLAAHFSGARDERVVEVHYTPRRYVRKPRGSAPGLVVLGREKVVVLRRQQELLSGLLGREVPP